MRLPWNHPATTPRSSGLRAYLGFFLPFLALSLLLTGCTRNFFRYRADREVADILKEKDTYLAWELNNYYVYPHPLARFGDPTNTDRSPMPPDDPAAWLLSPHPQKPKQVAWIEGTGYLDVLAIWDAENRARLKKQPAQESKSDSTEKLPISPKPVEPQPYRENPPSAQDRLTAVGGRAEPYLITFEQAVELGFFNSREYQNRREDLYLVALPVTLERFAFLPQFEAANVSIRDWAARNSTVGKQNRWISNSTLGFRQFFSTGALLLVQFANQTTINLTGNRPHTLSQSTLLLDAVQPLLRGGGRAVALEPLTQAERDLLYEIRDFARFQREFFVNIAAADPFAGAGPSVGYFPTLQRIAQLEYERENRRKFELLLSKTFEPFQRLGLVSELDTAQVRQSYLDSRSRVLQLEQQVAADRDRFNLQLGLPTDLPIDLDTSPLEELRNQLRRYNEIQANFLTISREFGEVVTQETDAEKVSAVGIDLAALLGAGGSLFPAPTGGAALSLIPATLPNIQDAFRVRSLRERALKAFTESKLVETSRLKDEILPRWESWKALSRVSELGLDSASQILSGALDPTGLPMSMFVAGAQPPLFQTRLDYLERRKDELELQQIDLTVDEKPVPPELLRELAEVTHELDVGSFELALQQYELQPWRGELNARQIQRTLFQEVSRQFALVLGEAGRELDLDVRQTWPLLPPLCLNGVNLLEIDLQMAENLVGETALINRLDLMNQRALVVDAWRRIAVFGNSLLGTFDVRYNMQVTTPPPAVAQPLDFDGERSRHQLILNTDLPLVRKLERNNYRASLIAYQRQRRALMAAEDAVLFQVRQELRQLRQLAEDYKIQQSALPLALIRVVSAELRLPEEGVARAANLTQQLVEAQNRVPSTQNRLIQIWTDYITTRMGLYRDLELMRVDSRGVWIDEFASPDCKPTADDRPAECHAENPRQ